LARVPGCHRLAMAHVPMPRMTSTATSTLLHPPRPQMNAAFILLSASAWSPCATCSNPPIREQVATLGTLLADQCASANVHGDGAPARLQTDNTFAAAAFCCAGCFTFSLVSHPSIASFNVSPGMQCEQRATGQYELLAPGGYCPPAF